MSEVVLSRPEVTSWLRVWKSRNRNSGGDGSLINCIWCKNVTFVEPKYLLILGSQLSSLSENKSILRTKSGGFGLKFALYTLLKRKWNLIEIDN